MKKTNGLLFVLLMVSIGFSAFFAGGLNAQAAGNGEVIGSPKLAVLVDARKVKFQGGDPFLEDNRVQVPLRGIGEALEAKIGFSGKTVTYEKSGKTIKLTLGSKTATVDGKSVTMDTVAIALNGRTYVPLRFVSENLGEKVEWDKVGQWVWIGSKDVPTLEEAGIKPQSIDKFKTMIGSAYSDMYEDMDNAYVLTEDQLPINLGRQTLYDLWQVKQDNNYGLQARYVINGGYPPIYYLTEGKSGARLRFDVQGMREKQDDGTAKVVYRITSRRDRDMIGDKNYDQFTLNQADYIAFSTSTGKSLVILKLK